MNYKDVLKKQLDAQAALVKVAIDEGRVMTPEEQTQYEALNIEIQNLEKTISIIDEQLKKEEDAKKPVNTPIYADPKTHTNVTDITKKIFGSAGRYFQAVHKSKTESSAAEKLSKYNNAILEFVNTASGMNESAPADGGFLVGTDVSTSLLERSYATGVLVGRTFEMPISKNSNSITLPYIDEKSRKNGSRYGGIQMYWDGEADQATGNKTKLGLMKLSLSKLQGLVYMTDELLEDAAALEAWITKKFPEEQGFKLDDAIINGTGNGMPLGIMNCPGKITVAKEVGQTAKTIIAMNCIRMYARFNGNPATAVWAVNRDCLPQLTTMSITIGASGVLVYMPPTGLSGNMYGTIFGIPVVPIEQCETIGTTGDIELIDLNKYIMANKKSLAIASSMHVRFEYGEMAYRFTYRCDGQPEIQSPLSAYKGTDTLSPYVVLATRA